MSHHGVSPKLWPHPTTSSVFKSVAHQSPDAFRLTQAEFCSLHSQSRYFTVHSTHCIFQTTTQWCHFVEVQQKTELTLGTWDKTGERIWELDCSGALGHWLLLWWPWCSGRILIMRRQSFLLLSLHSPHVSLKHQ